VLALVTMAVACVYSRRSLDKEMDGLARELDAEEQRIADGLYSEGIDVASVGSKSCASMDSAACSEGEVTEAMSTCTVSIEVAEADELELELEQTMRALMWAKYDEEEIEDEESMATASQSDVRQNNFLLLSPQSAWRGGGEHNDCDSETSVSVMSNESESSCC